MPNLDTGYAGFQLSKALLAAEPDEQRISAWTAVVTNILSHSAKYGSRTPIKDIPAWVTPEVVTGGFATGHWLAGGPLQAFEWEYLKQLPPVKEHNERLALNSHFLSDAGMAQLQEMLNSGCYEINVPEEGALLAVAWLARQGHATQARLLVDELVPFFSRLRFYPAPTGAPRRQGPRVHVQTAGEVKQALQAVRPNRQVLAQKEAVMVWAPFNDRVVALFAETYQDGWPCRVYAPDWSLRATMLLNEYRELRARHTLCRKQDKPNLHYARLRALLYCCAADPASLSERDIGLVRMIVDKNVAKHGPAGEARRAGRALQARDVAGPMHDRIAAVVVQRIDRFPLSDGIDDARQLLAGVTAQEATDAVPAQTPIPPTIRRKAMRCQSDSIEGLIRANLITSGEVMAKVLPQLSSGLSALSISDQQLRNLYAAVYRAFRRRRSLLLLNLERQVQLEELPWVAAVNQFRGNGMPHRLVARQALGATASLALAAFPHAPLPNKLLQELGALAAQAGVDIPLTEELASDIFMGRFSAKFNDALGIAAGLLDGTLYARYYGIDYGALQPPEESQARRNSWFGRPRQNVPAFDLAQACAERAGVPANTWRPATNGMIIEQQQILTSQNLAALFARLQLDTAMRAELPGLSRQCFKWVCKSLQLRVHGWHSDVIRIKNAAYAWRQMLFFLALQQDGEVADFAAWARSFLGEQPAQFQQAFSPAWKGLVAAINHVPIEQALGARRFLGWSEHRHWLASAY